MTHETSIYRHEEREALGLTRFRDLARDLDEAPVIPRPIGCWPVNDPREETTERDTRPVVPCAVSECGGTGAIPAAWMHVPMCLICRATKGGGE